jgi:hypothetical protein
MMTRAEHIRWCKERALEYIEQGNARDAYASMVSDMHKHPETVEVMQMMAPLGMVKLQKGNLEGVRSWIEKF